MSKLLIVIPTAGGLHEVTAAAAASLARQPGITLFIAKGRPHDYARNSAIRMFLNDSALVDHDRLLFLDSDIEPPQDVAQRLTAMDCPVATGCYPILMPSGLRWAVCRQASDGHYRCLEHLDIAPFAVDACGAGCLMIRRSVLQAISWPWFKWGEEENGHQLGEDIFFGDRCRQAGIPIMADPSVLCRHFKELDLLAMMPRRVPRKELKNANR